MANPRKFSEKIALHTQRQAEETLEFERIMQEVSAATARVCKIKSIIFFSPKIQLKFEMIWNWWSVMFTMNWSIEKIHFIDLNEENGGGFILFFAMAILKWQEIYIFFFSLKINLKRAISLRRIFPFSILLFTTRNSNVDVFNWMAKVRTKIVLHSYLEFFSLVSTQ